MLPEVPLRAVCLLCLALVLSGCKLALVVVEGGEVSSASGRFSCIAGSNGLIEVRNRSFADTFTAVPHTGYRFSHWLDADNGLCGGSTNPDCETRVAALPDNPAVDDILASDQTYYLIPVFVKEESEPGLSPALQAKYESSCDRCHTTGAFGAPVVHELATWEPRLAKGLNALLTSVQSGKGAMPPGGSCSNCSDDDYRALIEYMSGPTR